MKKNCARKIKFFFPISLILFFVSGFCFPDEQYAKRELFSLPKSEFSYQGWGFDDNDHLYSLNTTNGEADVFDETGHLINTFKWPTQEGVLYQISVDHDGKILIWNYQKAKCYLFSSGGKLLDSFISTFDIEHVVMRDGAIYSENSGKVFKTLDQSKAVSFTNPLNDFEFKPNPKDNGYFEPIVKRKDSSYKLTPPQHFSFYNFAAVDENGNVYAWFDKAMWGNGYVFSTDLPFSETFKTWKYDRNFNLLAQFDGLLFVNRRTQNLYGVQQEGDTYKFIKYEKIK